MVGSGVAWRAARPSVIKKIDGFPAVTATRVQLNILSSTSAARIREFQLYLWNEKP